MREIFLSDTALDCGMAAVLALLVYLISLFLCHIQGMSKDEIVKVLKSLDKVDRNLTLFNTLASKNSLDRDKARKLLFTIRVLIKNSASVLQVYIYEKEDKPRIRSAITKLNALEGKCDNIAIAYNNNKTDDISRTIESARNDLKRIQNLLNTAKKEQEDDRKKVI